MYIHLAYGNSTKFVPSPMSKRMSNPGPLNAEFLPLPKTCLTLKRRDCKNMMVGRKTTNKKEGSRMTSALITVN